MTQPTFIRSHPNAAGLVKVEQFGETIQSGKLLYRASDLKLYLADVDDPIKMPVIAVSLELSQQNARHPVSFHGAVFNKDYNFGNGAVLYPSRIAGLITEVEPSGNDRQQSIGYAISPDTFMFQPGFSVATNAASDVIGGGVETMASLDAIIRDAIWSNPELAIDIAERQKLLTIRNEADIIIVAPIFTGHVNEVNGTPSGLNVINPASGPATLSPDYGVMGRDWSPGFRNRFRRSPGSDDLIYANIAQFPANNITISGNGTGLGQRIAQKIAAGAIVDDGSNTSKISAILLNRNGVATSGSNLKIRIETDNAGAPSGTLINGNDPNAEIIMTASDYNKFPYSQENNQNILKFRLASDVLIPGGAGNPNSVFWIVLEVDAVDDSGFGLAIYNKSSGVGLDGNYFTEQLGGGWQDSGGLGEELAVMLITGEPTIAQMITNEVTVSGIAIKARVTSDRSSAQAQELTIKTLVIADTSQGSGTAFRLYGAELFSPTYQTINPNNGFQNDTLTYELNFDSAGWVPASLDVDISP